MLGYELGYISPVEDERWSSERARARSVDVLGVALITAPALRREEEAVSLPNWGEDETVVTTAP